MDLQDIWEQHRRWILGVLAGVVLFFVGGAVVDAAFDADGARQAVGRSVRALEKEEWFDAEARKLAEARHAELKAQEARLRAAVAFVPPEDFTLDGKGDADGYFVRVSDRVRRELLERAAEHGVEFADADLQWPSPVGREEIEQTLIGLGALDHAVRTLLEAGTLVRQQKADAIGLQAIEAFRIEKAGRTQRRTPYRRRGAAAELGDRVTQHRVAFQFRSDLATLQVFLETLRRATPALTLAPDGFKVVAGDQIDDPLVVRGTLAAVVVDEEAPAGALQ